MVADHRANKISIKTVSEYNNHSYLLEYPVRIVDESTQATLSVRDSEHFRDIIGQRDVVRELAGALEYLQGRIKTGASLEDINQDINLFLELRKIT